MRISARDGRLRVIDGIEDALEFLLSDALLALFQLRPAFLQG